MTAAGGFAISQATADTTTGGVLIAAARPGRRTLKLINLGAVDVWIGHQGVTSGTGGLLLGTKGTVLELDTQDAVYGLAASSTSAISVIETY